MRDDFLDPQCRPCTLDIYVIRSAILRALKDAMPRFSGTLVDVGCGDMPYRSLFTDAGGAVQVYIGLDVDNALHRKPDLQWNGTTIPLADKTADCILATEVLEHLPDPGIVLKEICRVLRPGGAFFFTTPFIWPLHEVPNDQYRFTPFSLGRHLWEAGFTEIDVKPLGGWNSALAQMIGLWVRRSLSPGVVRTILTWATLPVIWGLVKSDRLPTGFTESQMVSGLTGIAVKR